MAEPPTTSPASGAAPERDVLVATKFHVPPAGFVPRPRLLARLAGGIDRGLTVVCTPAGFGKTTLLGDWARRSRRPAAWLSLDEGDNDPARFWRYVAAALERVRPGVGAQVDVLLGGPQQPPLEAVATAVINQLMRVPGEGEVVLVLDDYHLVEAPPVHHSVAFLLDRLPPGLRLVVASRADPPLPLARLRARGQLAELRAADLLRARLQQTRPERVPGLHHAAAAWCQEHGFADDAVRHALAADEVVWAARLVERHVEGLLRRSEGATLGRWLAALPPGRGPRPGAPVPGPGGLGGRRWPAGGGRAAARRRRARVHGHRRGAAPAVGRAGVERAGQRPRVDRVPWCRARPSSRRC